MRTVERLRFALATFLLGLTGLLAALPALAQDGTVFGPKVYQRGSGGPVAVNDSFSVPPWIVAPFVLRIDNGDPAVPGAKRVTSATITVNGTQVLGQGDFGPHVAFLERPATLGGGSNELAVTITGDANTGAFLLRITGVRLPTVVSLVPAVSNVALGASTSLTLTISAAQTTDTTVPIAVSPSGIVSAPAQVVVPAGQTTVAVPVTAVALGQAGISASLNGTSASALVNVVPPPVAVTALEPASHTMTVGASSTFTVSINSVQLGDTQVSLASDNTAVLSVPSSVTVLQGQTSATFSATALAVGNALIIASANNTSKTASVHVSPQPAAIVSLLPNPLPLQQGASGALTVTINVAQETNLTIAIANSAPAIAQTPANVTLPAGAVSVPVPVTGLQPGLANVTASVNATSATSQVEVTVPPPVVTEITPATLTLPKGTPGVLRVTVSRAPNEPTAVSLVSSNPAAASVPPTVNIPAGALFADFPVASNAQGVATITASLNGGSATATVTIAAAELTSLVVSPQAASAFSGEQRAFTATGTLTDGTSEDFTTRVAWTSSNVTVATIAASGIATALAAGQTTIQASFTFTAAQTGQLVTITATSLLTVSQSLTIISVTPAAAAVGQTIALAGTGFDPVPIGNLIVFRGINNTTATATVLTATATQITVRVPPLADSGPITLTNSRGTVESPPFTVTREQDFQLVVSPASLMVFQGASTSAQAQLASTGTMPFTGLATLSVQGLPAGVTASFSPAVTLSALQSGTITFGAAGSAAPGTYPLTVSAEMKEAGQAFTRTASVSLVVQASGNITGAKGRFVTPQGAGIPGIIVRGDIGTNPQPQTTTDAAGNFVLTGLPAGPVTLRFDATPANPLYPIWPQTVTLIANQILVMEDWTIAPPPSDDKFTLISANSPQVQIITDARYPGLEIKIPAGTTITGWDGVPKSRIALERLDPDKLPVAAPPIKTKSVYQLYFGTPMGGLPSNAIPVTLPNDLGLEPGRQTALWYYDGSPMGGTGEWKQGGTGTVSADGTVIVADAGSGIPRFCGVCGLPCYEGAQNEAPDVSCDDDCRKEEFDPSDPFYGKPVHLYTGQELESAVDLVVDGEVPIVIRRRFNPFDAFAYIGNFQQSLGINWTFAGYDVAMLPFGGDHSVRIVLPGNRRVDFKRGTDGKFRSSARLTFDGADMIKVGGTNPTSLGAIPGGQLPPGGTPIAPQCPFDGSFYLVQFKDGREWRFDGAPNATRVRIRGGCLYFLSEMRDAQGRFVKIIRSEGKIQRVETSSGQFVNFGYTNGVVSQVTDNTGRTVSYGHVLVPGKGGFRGLGAATDGSASQVTATESAAISSGLIPIPPFRLTTAVTPEGTYAYTYEDDPPTLRLGALSFNDGAGVAISPDLPTCQNVRGGARIKTIQLPGVVGVFTNFYGPSKRVLRQTWPDGTEIRFNWKVVGGCVPGLVSSSSQPTEGSLTGGGSNSTTCSGAGCIRTDSWEGQSVTGGAIVGVEVTDARGKKFGREFNSTGMATKVIDANGQELRLTRDVQNRITQRTDALGRVTTYQYGAKGNRTKIIDPAGRETTIEHDVKWNKPTLVSRRLNASTVIEYRYSYDVDTGVLLTSTDPESNVTQYQYDTNRRLARILDPLTHATAIEYDTQGNPRRIVDALGNAIEMLTDSGARIVQTTDALGNDTRAEYNSLNQLTKMVDARLGETRFNFDGRNKLASVVNPLNNTIEAYGYDSIGRLQTKTDAKTKSETYGYDANGNLSSITDRRLQATTITYDSANRPSRIQYHDGSAQDRTYDAAGRLTDIRQADNAQQLAYDSLDRVVRVATDTVAGSTSIAYEYDALDRRTKRTVYYPGGVLEETVYVYDKASRLTSISQTGTNGTQSTTYAWDIASRLTQKTLPNGIRQQFGYDDANRLLSIAYKKTDDTLIEEVTYAYDANGQRIARSSGTGTLRDTTFGAAYDEANRMSSITLNPGTPSEKTYTLGYDDHGNLVSKQNSTTPAETTTYQWDARNRLVGISAIDIGGTSLASFKYDALGRRIERTVTQGATTQRTQYVYDGIQAIGELTDGRLATTILTGLNIDEVIARTVNVSGGQSPVATKSYLTDALGSVLAITNATQNPELFYSYSAYGETQQLGADPDSPANAAQYTSRENDGLVGGTTGGSLYYYRTRYYDPVLKRFVAEDQIGIDGGDNLYSYAGGNPPSYTDPTGELVFVPMLVGAGIGVGLEIGLQAIRNFREGCDIFNVENYDWWDVGIAAGIGILAPGWLSVGRTASSSSRAMQTLSGQLGRAQTANRAAKIEGRIQRHRNEIADALALQGAFQGAKALAKYLNDENRKCVCRE